MSRYALRRLASAVPMLVLLSMATFLMLDLAPGDAAQALLARGAGVRAEDVAALRTQLGLDQPLPERYVHWASGVLHFDFGRSYRSGREVRDMLAGAVGPTMLLQGISLGITALGSLALGVLAGTRRWASASRLVNVFVVLSYSTPSFLIAIFAILVFSVRLGWLPPTGMSTPGEDLSVAQVASHVILPALALAFSHHFGSLIRIVEATVAQTRQAPFIEAARARGIRPATVLLRYTTRSAMVPFVAQLGALVGALVAGAYVVEAIFSWPGVGRIALEAANGRDYPVLTAVILLSGVVVIAGNVLADIAVAFLDPRVRLEGDRRPAGRRRRWRAPDAPEGWTETEGRPAPEPQMA